MRLRYQEKLEPATGDHDTIPFKEDCSNPNIEVEECDAEECENFARRTRRVLRGLWS